jgi:iron complex transport system ATP-binding protein
MSMLSAHNLALVAGDKMLVSSLTLAFEPGQSWAVLGPNGSGKTTLLTCLAGLRQPDAGEIQLRGTNLGELPQRQRAREIGMVFQHYDDAFPSTVLDHVMAGRHPHIAGSLFATETGEDRRIADDALQHMELADLAPRSITTLSGGERRRVDIAVLLAQDTPVRILDEPCNHLDLRHQGSVLNHLTRTSGEGKLNIFALHDVNHALSYCDHALLLFEDGSVQAGPIETTAGRETLEQLYQCRLIEVSSGHNRMLLPDFS